jgi:enoyl-CoA hydratase/carnithine racemase
MQEIWVRSGTTGILSLQSSKENYLDDPEFIRLDLLKKIFNEPGLKGIIIRGSGRHFSAGADLTQLKQLAGDEPTLFNKISAGKELVKLIVNARIPVIAEISGICFGGGLEIALACHIRICSENALFAFPETNYGIIPGLGGTVTLTKLIGSGRSAEIILSGDMINARKALELKMVDYVLPSGELHDYTTAYLDRLTSDRDTEVIHAVMQSIYNAENMEFEKALEEETKLFCALALKNMPK